MLCKCSCFTVEEIQVSDKFQDNTYGLTFHIYMVIEGKGTVRSLQGTTPILLGDTLLIPGVIGDYTIEGKIRLLKTYI
jgi:mannose-6-phosphate isomerase